MVLLSPLLAVMVVAIVPWVILVGPFVWLASKWQAWRRRSAIARPRRSWFAWRPVHFDAFWEDDDVPSQWLWLETVEAVWQRGEWTYRPAGFVSRFDEASA